MSSVAARLSKFIRASVPSSQTSSLAVGGQRSSKLWYSSSSTDSKKKVVAEEDIDDFLGGLKDVDRVAHGVDPKRGWGFRGVHRAIICGRVGQSPVQKILRNGRTVTIFTVGTGGMFDQRLLQKDLPKPAQWHRIAVHNDRLGAYAVKQFVKNSSVYVEGDIETRVYNNSITGEVNNIPEICIRHDGKIRLIKSGESISSIFLDDLRKRRLTLVLIGTLGEPQPRNGKASQATSVGNMDMFPSWV
ncbi:hypothetical protein ACLB2K_060840 [Fragaria x ananassa]